MVAHNREMIHGFAIKHLAVAFAGSDYRSIATCEINVVVKRIKHLRQTWVVSTSMTML